MAPASASARKGPRAPLLPLLLLLGCLLGAMAVTALAAAAANMNTDRKLMQGSEFAKPTVGVGTVARP